MPTQSAKGKRLTCALLIVYLLVLTWLILFKLQVDFTGLVAPRSINFIPFAGSAIVNGRVHLPEILWNVAVFVPFGLYLALLREDWPILRLLAPIFGVSLLFETLQYVFSIGGSDVTDLITNTCGGLIGIGLCYALRRLLKARAGMVVNVVGTVGTVLVVGMLGFLTLCNL